MNRIHQLPKHTKKGATSIMHYELQILTPNS